MKAKLLSPFFLFSIAFTTLVHAYEPKPYVTCWMKSGQLGNQLYEVATALAFAWDHDMEPLFPELNYTHYNIPINKERIFFRLNSSRLPRPIYYIFENPSNYEMVEIPSEPDIMLKGFFQNWRYFDHHRESLLDIFAPKKEEIEGIRKKHGDLLDHPFTVGVHVRTFNYEWNSILPFLGLDYYEKAMSLFPKEALFVIFSDRINWCKHHFVKFDRDMVFIDDQDHIQDLYLMSMMKHNIIANSTFSWWGAYFNRNPDKIIVAPPYYFSPKVIDSMSEKKTGNPVMNPNMPGWIEIEFELSEYPRDMKHYDARSQSLDTQ